jgi:2'-5' RNA ligase
VPLAVTLRVDDRAAERLEALRLAARDATDPPHHGYPPHLTLAVVPEDTVAAAEATLRRLSDGWDRLPLRIAGLGAFPAPVPVLWAAPVVTAELLARQEALCNALAGVPIDPHYRPGAWVPHVTLRQGGTAPMAEALDRVLSLWDDPIAGWLDRVELVAFPPVRVLLGRALP